MAEYIFDHKTNTFILISGLDEKNIKEFFENYKNKEKIEILDLKNFESDTLPKMTFYKWENLKKVILSSSIKTIGSGCFCNCVKLKEINLDNVEIIGENAFNSCEKLQKIGNATSIKLIDYGAFMVCEKLTGNFNFTFPVKINCKAFSHCCSLSNIHFRSTVEFEKDVFNQCVKLPKDIFVDLNLEIDREFLCTVFPAFKFSNLESYFSSMINEPKPIKKVKFSGKWTNTSEPLFTKGLPSPSDIAQGSIGDCVLLAALSSIAASNPQSIKKCMVDDIEKCCVYVSLFEVQVLSTIDKLDKKGTLITVGRKVIVPVERSTAEVSFANKILGYTDRFFGRHALWVKIMEKAIATYFINNAPSLEKDISKILDGVEPVVIAMITGKIVKCFNLFDENDRTNTDITQVYTSIYNKIQKCKIVSCSLRKETPCGNKLPHPHAYSILGALKYHKPGSTDGVLPVETADLYRKNIFSLLDLAKPILGNEEKMFFVLRNPHAKCGVIAIYKDDKCNFKTISNNDGICLIEVKFFIKYFDSNINRTSSK